MKNVFVVFHKTVNKRPIARVFSTWQLAEAHAESTISDPEKRSVFEMDAALFPADMGYKIDSISIHS